MVLVSRTIGMAKLKYELSYACDSSGFNRTGQTNIYLFIFYLFIYEAQSYIVRSGPSGLWAHNSPSTLPRKLIVAKSKMVWPVLFLRFSISYALFFKIWIIKWKWNHRNSRYIWLLRFIIQHNFLKNLRDYKSWCNCSEDCLLFFNINRPQPMQCKNYVPVNS